MQAILAGAFARQDYESAKESVGRVPQVSLTWICKTSTARVDFRRPRIALVP
jgi:hypothetical protein